jgi:hypothetical protein
LSAEYLPQIQVAKEHPQVLWWVFPLPPLGAIRSSSFTMRKCFGFGVALGSSAFC